MRVTSQSGEQSGEMPRGAGHTVAPPNDEMTPDCNDPRIFRLYLITRAIDYQSGGMGLTPQHTHLKDHI